MPSTAELVEVRPESCSQPYPPKRSNPLVLWHLLSLDAPTVATLWTWFFAAANHIRLPAITAFAMALAVWTLYVADRLLDTRSVGRASNAFPYQLEERHFFHHRNRRRFSFGVMLASTALAALLPWLPPSSIRLYGILGGMLLAYLILVHVSGSIYRLPKELAVGVFFSAANFIPTVSRQPSFRYAVLPGAVLFAVLCTLNCLFIFNWEHPEGSVLAHPATRAALGHLPCLSAIAIVCAVATVLTTPTPWQIPVACAASAALLMLLHGTRKRLALSTLRACADVCLLTPLMFAFSLR